MTTIYKTKAAHMDNTTLLGFFDKMPPSLWVCWLYEMKPGRSREQVSTILFKNEQLVDLTSPTIRKKIRKLIGSNSEFTNVVSRHCEEFISALCKKVK